MHHSRILLALASTAFLACSSSPSPGPEVSGPEDGGATNDATAPDGSKPGDAGRDAADATTPDGSQPTGAADSGVDGASDAAGGPDAADATPDAIEEPPPPTTVEVLVVNAAGPEMGVTVVFSDATGALITTGVTDANGTVVQQLAAGSQVTAELGQSYAPNLVTVAGVKPGDVLKLLDGPFLSNQGVAEVTFNGLADASASDYLLSSGVCGVDTDGGTGTFDYGIGPQCTNASGQFPVLAQANGGAGTLAWQSGKGNLVTDGGVSPVNLSSATWSTTFGTETLTLTNVGDGVGPYTAFTEYASSDSVSSVPYSVTNFGLNQLDAGLFESTFTIHPGLGDFDQAEVEYQITQSGGNSLLAIATRVSATTAGSPSASVTIDVSDVLPAITGATLDATNPGQPKFAWTSAAPLSVSAATFVQAQWTEALDDAGTVRTGTWTVIVPASQMSATAPQIPSASGFGPGARSTWPATFPIVFSMNGDGFSTYDTVRALAARVGSSLSAGSSPLVPPLPANGRARITAFVPVVPQP
jgi:hypothetical protein